MEIFVDLFKWLKEEGGVGFYKMIDIILLKRYIILNNYIVMLVSYWYLNFCFE